MGESISPFTSIDLLRLLVQHVRGISRHVPGDVLVYGSGPLDEYDFKQVLEENGLQVRNEDEVPETLIVGQEIDDYQELDEIVLARVGNTLKVFSQEMFVYFIATGVNPFDLGDDIWLFADGHPVLEYLSEKGFDWPTTKVPEAWRRGGSLDDGNERVEKSPLKALGYTVGLTDGKSTGERRQILTKAFKEELPSVGPKSYMEEWGNPNTAKRLRRIAHHIADQVISRKLQDPVKFAYAIRDWEEDLAWLKKTFYNLKVYGFQWPDIHVR